MKLNALDYHTAYGLIMLNKQDPKICDLLEGQSEPEIHGDKIWHSSFLIMDHLRHHPLKPNTRVLEAGCGWGC